MPKNIITEKINDLYPGQILAHYKFFLIQEEKSFSFYKNDKNFFLFVYHSPNNNILFLETLEFKSLDKTDLFYFLADKLDMDSLLESVKDVIKIEDFDEFQFTEKISERELIDLYYRLEQSEFLKGTPLENFAFRRDGSDVLIFKDVAKTPVDVVSFVQNNEEVFSEFGNNFGSHFIKNPNSNTALLSFHPELIFNNDNRENYNILITKYQVSLVELLSVLKRESLEEIHIPVKEIYSYIYRLKILLNFFNFFSSKVRFELSISANFFFAELYFTINGGTMEKLEVINQVASFQNSLKKLFNDHSENIKESVYNFYAFKVDMFSSGENHCGKILFRNNISLLSIVINSFQDKLNALDKCNYKFV
ncbi:hypothetical protein [uncultured Flavobacterium sp.]|uniref:hypothetical protein n=1 Tax=uncultured Flavobacterium sp. TaxID=165435 RepID=UPI002596A76E|nr:hypothetical protein [uncultured Flavobacterium sp.]